MTKHRKKKSHLWEKGAIISETQLDSETGLKRINFLQFGKRTPNILVGQILILNTLHISQMLMQKHV